MSELKTNKVSPATSTALAIGDSGDTITVPSGATLDISASTLTPPATMPASSGVNFTALNATNLGSGTVPTARLGSGTADATTFLRGDQTYATAGGNNTPAFFAYLTANQTITDNTNTKLECDGELFDTDTAYDKDTNYRFTVPAGEGGKYVVTSQIAYINGNSSGERKKTMIYVNGVEKAHSYDSVGVSGADWHDTILLCQTILVLSATDYVEAYGLWKIGSGTGGFGGNASSMSSYFSAFKLIGV